MKNLRVRGLVPQFENGQLHDPKEAGWSVLKYYLRFIGSSNPLYKPLIIPVAIFISKISGTVVGQTLAVQTLAGFWIFLEIFKKQ